MAIIQSINGDQFKTFDNLAATYMQGLLQCFSEANTVVDVYDRYDNMESVKQGERERRQDADPGCGSKLLAEDHFRHGENFSIMQRTKLH
jgi:hypothetical protein